MVSVKNKDTGKGEKVECTKLRSCKRIRLDLRHSLHTTNYSSLLKILSPLTIRSRLVNNCGLSNDESAIKKIMITI